MLLEIVQKAQHLPESLRLDWETHGFLRLAPFNEASETAPKRSVGFRAVATIFDVTYEAWSHSCYSQVTWVVLSQGMAINPFCPVEGIRVIIVG